MSKRTRSSSAHRVTAINHDVFGEAARLEAELIAEDADLAALCPDTQPALPLPSAPVPPCPVVQAPPPAPSADKPSEEDDSADAREAVLRGLIRKQKERLAALERELASARAVGSRAAQAAREQRDRNGVLLRELRSVSSTLTNANTIHDNAMTAVRGELAASKQFNERLRKQVKDLTVIAKRAPALLCPACSAALPWHAVECSMCAACMAAWDDAA